MMKTWKILSSDNRVLTFTENNSTYSLHLDGNDGEQMEIFEATDTDNGLEFAESFGSDLDYATLDYLRLFLNMIGKIDLRLYESYIILEPIGQI